MISYETLIAQDVQDLKTKARDMYKKKYFYESALAYIEALKIDSTEPNIYYGAACSFALSGKKEEAFQYLFSSLNHGFKDCEWLEKDKDLISLYNDSNWNTVKEKCKSNFTNYLKTINNELYGLYKQDQLSRSKGTDKIDWIELAKNDSIRRKRVIELFQEGKIIAADDYYHAALIFQHGIDTNDILKAYLLAEKAVELKSSYITAKWLMAATKDRYLMYKGLPQWYGTQFQLKEGKWILYPVDSNAVTDKDRKKLGVPSLDEALKLIEKRNQQIKK